MGATTRSMAKVLHHLGIAELVLCDDLEGDAPPHGPVFRPVDAAHAPGTQHVEHDVGTDEERVGFAPCDAFRLIAGQQTVLHQSLRERGGIVGDLGIPQVGVE